MMILYYLYIFIISFFTTFITTPLVIKLALKINKTGVDIHKPSKPIVPSLGGIAILIGILSGSLSSLILFHQYYVETLLFLLVVLINGIIGLIDDFKVLKGIVKMSTTILSTIPLIASSYLFPDKIVLGRPEVPFLGKLRLTLVYWALLPLIVGGSANAVNMLEVFNGVMPGTCSFIAIAILLSSIILNKTRSIIFSIIMLGSLLSYYYYNKYPAKVFSGDVGSLSVGGAFGAIAIICRLEIVVMIALIPHIINAFYVISSVKGFKERRTIRYRPVEVMENGLIKASKEKDAPITLTRIILSITGPLEEKYIIKTIFFIEICTSILAIITAFLIKVKI
ncbi:MAG: hypothetical protein DRJ45_02230 [Thermoprotei archaeon]|nr:MAG: hypothetical protein DRJ45_02230 [Thermoprotei archaeon]